MLQPGPNLRVGSMPGPMICLNPGRGVCTAPSWSSVQVQGAFDYEFNVISTGADYTLAVKTVLPLDFKLWSVDTWEQVFSKRKHVFLQHEGSAGFWTRKCHAQSPGSSRVCREGFMVLEDRFSGSQVLEHLGGLCPVNGSGRFALHLLLRMGLLFRGASRSVNVQRRKGMHKGVMCHGTGPPSQKRSSARSIIATTCFSFASKLKLVCMLTPLNRLSEIRLVEDTIILKRNTFACGQDTILLATEHDFIIIKYVQICIHTYIYISITYLYGIHLYIYRYYNLL